MCTGTSIQVIGPLYAATMTSSTPSNPTTAVADMETVYDFAAGRTLSDELNLSSGAIGALPSSLVSIHGQAR
ncbi:MAG: hypothetical protein JEY71_17480 [Sphaerochaeta sp.]|nr:hypothetical protein [Sphaerochaeta sp.]